MLCVRADHSVAVNRLFLAHWTHVQKDCVNNDGGVVIECEFYIKTYSNEKINWDSISFILFVCFFASKMQITYLTLLGKTTKKRTRECETTRCNYISVETTNTCNAHLAMRNPGLNRKCSAVWNRWSSADDHQKDNLRTEQFILPFCCKIFDFYVMMSLKLYCRYLYTRPCMINHIWGLKQLWLQVNGHAWFHLQRLRWPVRNGEGAKNSKWKYMSPAGFEPTPRLSTTGKLQRLRPLVHDSLMVISG